MIERDGKKLILHPQAKVARIFDLRADPDEMMDLSKSTAGREFAVPLFQRLLKIQRETGDLLDLRATFPGLATGLDGEKSR